MIVPIQDKKNARAQAIELVETMILIHAWNGQLWLAAIRLLAGCQLINVQEISYKGCGLIKDAVMDHAIPMTNGKLIKNVVLMN